MFKPKYTISDRIIRQLTEIAVSRDIIERAKLVPKWELSLLAFSELAQHPTMPLLYLQRSLISKDFSGAAI